MLILLQITTEGGTEAFSYKTEKYKQVMVDTQLLSGFMEALQLLSETIGSPLQQIQLANLMLYVRTYGNFSLRLLLEEKMDEGELEGYFGQIAKQVVPLLADQSKGIFPNEKVFQEKLLPIITPLIQDPLAGTKIQDLSEKAFISKVALVGLANAGKTSIKNMFFENWSAEKARKTQPTIGVETSRKFLEFLKHKFLVVDFGGQIAYRKQYLTQEKNWIGITTLIFVVDVQDLNSYEAARDYLSEIWKIASEVNERKTKLSIFIHKCDFGKRKGLGKNISEALSHFREFVDFASFHFTTIEDSSSNIALIRTLYFSLPNIMLRKLLEDEFLDYFERTILPHYSELARDEGFGEILNQEMEAVQKSAVILGMSFGRSLEETWLNYLMGDWTPRRRLLSSKSLSVTQKGQSLLIKIPNWTEQGIPKNLTTILLDGMLEGMLKTFHLDPPKKITDDRWATTWEIRA